MKRIIPIICIGAVATLASCGPNQQDPEVMGQQMLNEARTLLSQGNTDAARDTIMSLRQRYPLAIQVRRQAILTLDSIELQAARNEGDSLKIEFYTRKIEFDKENNNK